MLIYILIIAFFNALFVVFNQFVYVPFNSMPIWFNVVGVVSSTIAVIAIDGIAAAVCHALQKKHFNPQSKFFNVSLKERNLWKKLGFKTIKQIVPDLGGLVKFPKGKIQDPNSPEYIHLYLKESCSGEIGHIVGMALGFLIILIFPKYWYCFGLPVAIVNFVMSFLPVVLLRHNRYSLNNIYKNLIKREERKLKQSNQTQVVKQAEVVANEEVQILVTDADMAM